MKRTLILILSLAALALNAWAVPTTNQTARVTIVWSPGSGTNVIANYNVYYGVASATYINTVSSGTNTTVTISNLVHGVTYYFAATAVDTSGLESDFSNEISWAVPTNPPPPQNLHITVSVVVDVNVNANLQKK